MRGSNVIALLFTTVQCAFAQTNHPILIGDGRDAVSATAVENLAHLGRSVGGQSATIWMLHCDAYKSGPNEGHVFRVNVYFQPRVSSGRLLRGEGILCADSTMPQYWDQKSPRSGGWYSCDKQPAGYGLVAPAGHTMATYRPTEKPFAIMGSLSDSDVLAIVDAVRLSTTNQLMQSIEARDATHIRVRTAKGGSWEGLRIDFQKEGEVWKQTERGRWVV